ncbi:head GIN domain-containing protein [Aurantiacibacter spongiae]|uniref:DUF2807 domain-containing protein n=1 Tax=Aurantiacibacter spongiae TaxID=2488860 RepID=A0A3N5CR55_9SPHN|nr:head GIN domain-containing protein [Aurantiacibacter spongiae]RPF71603.1 DUF2807 domain-containing protein [Aurantiacibacter spongiae]
MTFARSAAAGLALLVIATACSSADGAGWREADIIGSGNVVERQVEIGNFDRIVANGPVSVEVRQGPRPSVTIEAEDNIVNLIDVDVSGDTLVIGSHGSWSSRRDVRAVVTAPGLRDIEKFGSGRVRVVDWNADSLALSTHGSGGITLSGRIDTLALSTGGSGSIDAGEATVRDATASTQGSGSITLGDLDRLSAAVAGSGSIRAGRVGQLTQSDSGSGSIRVAN